MHWCSVGQRAATRPRPGQFGLTGNQKVGIPFGTQPFYVGFSGQSIGDNADYIRYGTNARNPPRQYLNYYDNLTWQHRRHLFSFGVQATRFQQNYLNASNFGFLGEFDYNGIFTSNPNVTTGGGGYSPADFVLDRVAENKLGSTIGIVGNRRAAHCRVRAGQFQGDTDDDPQLRPPLSSSTLV